MKHVWGSKRWKFSTQYEECINCGIKRILILYADEYMYGDFWISFSKEMPECSEQMMKRALK
jgi:hypothetical protein